MDSLDVVFTGALQVEVTRQRVPDVGSRQVLVHASRSLISTGTEGIIYGRLFAPDTHWDRWVKYPFRPGYSLVGQIVAVGADVQGYRGLERVALRAPHRQYTVVEPGALTRVPDGVTDEDATWFGLSNIVQTGVRHANHALGDTVVVVGLGLLGQLVVQYVRLLGAKRVIAIDTAPRRLQMAREHGATDCIETPVADAREDVMQLTGGRGADVVYDVTGNAAVLPAALGLVRTLGTLLLLGDTGTPSEQRLTPDVLTRGLRIVGAHDGNPPAVGTDHAPWGRVEMADLFFDYVTRGDLKLSSLVTHRYAPVDAAAAYRMLAESRAHAMGVIFDWSHA
ncbi:MAG TPA: zinc-binding alcohol dehydrogenase [Chthonomonadales bacterium]|nr:zinc-binding alcohol dehydrogenase [Chthonomonadales bacterium]